MLKTFFKSVIYILDFIILIKFKPKYGCQLIITFSIWLYDFHF